MHTRLSRQPRSHLLSANRYIKGNLQINSWYLSMLLCAWQILKTEQVSRGNFRFYHNRRDICVTITHNYRKNVIQMIYWNLLHVCMKCNSSYMNTFVSACWKTLWLLTHGSTVCDRMYSWEVSCISSQYFWPKSDRFWPNSERKEGWPSPPCYLVPFYHRWQYEFLKKIAHKIADANPNETVGKFRFIQKKTEIPQN